MLYSELTSMAMMLGMAKLRSNRLIFSVFNGFSNGFTGLLSVMTAKNA